MHLKRILCAGLCAALCAALAGCSGTAESSSAAESSAVSAVSSEPEAESSRFVPAPDLIPSTPEAGSSLAPDSFEALFSQNPIDKKYDEDYSYASSFSMMQQACDDAARNWKNMVDTAYRAALKALPDEEKNALTQEQDDWLSETENRIDVIRQESGDDNEGILSAAKEIVLVYRDRAMELCRLKFEADGTLPEFPDAEALDPAG